MSDFQYLVTSHFPRGLGNTVIAVRPGAEKTRWMEQIMAQIQRQPTTRLVGVDDYYNYTNVVAGTFIKIDDIVFEVNHIRGGRPCRIFMLKPLIGMTSTFVEDGHVGPHFPNSDDRLVKTVNDLNQALAAVADAAEKNFTAALMTDGSVFSKIYYEDYAASEMGDLFERLVALKKRNGEEFVVVCLFS